MESRGIVELRGLRPILEFEVYYYYTAPFLSALSVA